MSIVPSPIEYAPGTDATGMYVDVIPNSAPHGIVCPCGSRKQYAYSRANFRAHIHCETHRRWLETVNSDRLNYYQEAIQSRIQIKACQVRIATMQKEIQTLKKEIQIAKAPKQEQVQYVETTDLIDFS